MKAITQKMINNPSGVVGRVVIDRTRNTAAAILKETRDIDKEFNSKLIPSALYNYYISVCQVPMWDLTNDKKVAQVLGHTVRAVSDTRRKLTKGGWILFDTHMDKGIKYGTWYIGKEVVASQLSREKSTSLEELKDIGVLLDDEYGLIKKYEERVENE